VSPERAELRAALRGVAEADEEELGERIDEVEELLDRYDAEAESGADDRDGPSRFMERTAAARVELERLRAGEVPRRDAVGRMRLILLSQQPDRSGDRDEA